MQSRTVNRMFWNCKFTLKFWINVLFIFSLFWLGLSHWHCLYCFWTVDFVFPMLLQLWRCFRHEKQCLIWKLKQIQFQHTPSTRQTSISSRSIVTWPMARKVRCQRWRLSRDGRLIIDANRSAKIFCSEVMEVWVRCVR